MVFLAQSSGSCIDTFIYEKSTCQSRCLFFSAPEKIRTPDTTVRSRMLYPTELLTHFFLLLAVFLSNVDYYNK